jgi:hypothetical protein
MDDDILDESFFQQFAGYEPQPDTNPAKREKFAHVVFLLYSSYTNNKAIPGIKPSKG